MRAVNGVLANHGRAIGSRFARIILGENCLALRDDERSTFQLQANLGIGIHGQQPWSPSEIIRQRPDSIRINTDGCAVAL